MDDYQITRTRTITWDDPAEALQAAQTMSGCANNGSFGIEESELSYVTHKQAAIIM